MKYKFSNKKSVLKTIRISDHINRILEKDSSSRRITVNALISSIMTKYSEWDRYMERSGGITLKPQAFKEILEAIDEDKLTSIARRVGSRYPREMVLFWFKKEGIETYLESLKLICKYKGFAQFELEIEGTEHTIILIHDLGEKWSRFLRCIIEEGMKSVTGITPKFEVNYDSVMVKFDTKPKL